MGADTTGQVAEEAGRRESPRCYLCRRDVWDGDYLNVTIRGGIERICSVCWEKRDEDGIEIPLDMTEDEDE